MQNKFLLSLYFDFNAVLFLYILYWLFLEGIINFVWNLLHMFLIINKKKSSIEFSTVLFLKCLSIL